MKAERNRVLLKRGNPVEEGTAAQNKGAEAPASAPESMPVETAASVQEIPAKAHQASAPTLEVASPPASNPEIEGQVKFRVTRFRNLKTSCSFLLQQEKEKWIEKYQQARVSAAQAEKKAEQGDSPQITVDPAIEQSVTAEMNLEREAEQLDRGLEVIAKEINEIKDSMTDERKRNLVDPNDGRRVSAKSAAYGNEP